MTFDTPDDADARPVGERLHRRQGAELGLCSGGDGLGDRVLAGILERAGQAQHVRAAGAVHQPYVDQLDPALGHRSGLVEDDRADPARLLEHLRPLDEDAELRCAACPHHQRCGRGEPERAGASDDEHRDGCGERFAGISGEDEPAGERGQSDADHDRHEHGRHAVREALDRRFARLSLGDETRDLRQRRLLADSHRPDDESPVRVDRPAGDLCAGADFEGHRLAGEHGLVDRRLAFLHDAVGCDLLAGANDEAVADLQLCDGDEHLLAVAEHPGLLRAELEQRAHGRTGATLGALLQVPADQDQRHDHGTDLEVHLGVDAANEHDGRPRPRGERADRDQRVHRDRAMARVAECGAVERPAGPEHDRRRERERRPLPAFELERRHHRDQRQGDRERDSDYEPLPHRCAFPGCFAVHMS